LNARSTKFAKLRIKSEKADALVISKPSASISLNGLGASFFGLYPQLCDFCNIGYWQLHRTRFLRVGVFF
jgi:hypothetical protein